MHPIRHFLKVACFLALTIGGCAQESTPEADDTDPVDSDAEETDDTVPLGPEYSFSARDLTQFVDPFIGSDGPGNVIPGALVPHGMVRASPVSTIETDEVTAYHRSDARFRGFSHTHLEGAGGSRNGYSHLLITPGTNGISSDLSSLAWDIQQDNESASPGSYSVLVPEAFTAEVTATSNAAIHRYTFAPQTTPTLAFNLGHSLGESLNGKIEFLDAEHVQGFGQYNVHPVVSLTAGTAQKTGNVTVYFWAEFSQPATNYKTWRSSGEPSETPIVEGSLAMGALEFGAQPGEFPLEIRLGISFVSVEQAQINAAAQVLEFSFDEIANKAANAWNEKLNRIQIEGTLEEKSKFYTALYHAMFQPADYTEENGIFMDASSGTPVVGTADGWRYLTDDWCLWDTYRTSHPLRTIIEPDIALNEVRSLLYSAKQSGWIPKCPWNATGHSRVMTGNPALPIIADSFIKGLDNFDAAAALDAMVKLSDEDENPAPVGLCGYFGLGTPPEYVENGFVSRECDPTQSASMTLEYAYADWTVAQMARAALNRGIVATPSGRDVAEIAERFDARAANWRNHWDSSVGFMRGKTRNGNWVEPFDPADTSDANDFVEASAWIFTFFVPHDVPALAQEMGGNEALIAKLDGFFDGGHFDPTNQPSFHIPWLYAAAGRRDLTVPKITDLVENEYGLGNNGLPGNDDAGSTSALLVLSMLGLYQIAPGSPDFQLGSPTIDSAEIFLSNTYFDGGSAHVVSAPTPETLANWQSVTLNGEPVQRTTISHAELVGGARVEF